MVKKNVTTIIWTVIIISALLISLSFNYILFKQKENSTELAEKITILKNYQIFIADNEAKLSVVSASLDKLNYTIDYDSCILYNSKLKERSNLYSEEESETASFLSKFVGKNPLCEQKVGEYEKEREILKGLREEYLEADKNYCFGYHKVDWSNTWSEQYSSPLRRIGILRSESSEKIEKLKRDAMKICLS